LLQRLGALKPKEEEPVCRVLAKWWALELFPTLAQVCEVFGEEADGSANQPDRRAA